MRFTNRQEAGRLLAEALRSYTSQECIVYALPRGGVVLGAEIARQIRAPLDLVISRKIGHPRWEEYAVGAVTEDGHFVCNKEELSRLDPAWLKQSITQARAEARRRRLTYLAHRPSRTSNNKVAIVVDDGITTGLTLIAAVQALRDQKPTQVIAAVPVIARSVSKQLERYVDTIVALEISDNYLGSTSSYYDTFDPVYDDEVIALLHNQSHKTKGVL